MLAWLRDAFAYPIRGEHPGDAVAAIWLLLLVEGLVPVVPLVPLAGFLVRELGASLDGVDAPRSALDDVAGLVRTGIGATAISAAYLGLPVACLLLTLGGAASGGRLASRSLLVLAALTVGAVALLTATYLLPIGLAGYAATGSLRSAFDADRLRTVARSGRYLLGWLGCVLVLDVAGLVGVAIAGRSVLGWLLATLLAAYVLPVGVRLIGVGVAVSRDPEPT